MNTAKQETEEKRKGGINSDANTHYPDTLEQQIEQWMDETEKEPKETTKGKNKQTIKKEAGGTIETAEEVTKSKKKTEAMGAAETEDSRSR